MAVRRWLIALLGLGVLAGVPMPPVGAVSDAERPVVSLETLDVVAVDMAHALARPALSAELRLGREALRSMANEASDEFVTAYLGQADAARVLAQQALELVGEHRYGGIALDIPNQRIRLFLAGADFDAVRTVLAERLPGVVVTTKVEVSLADLRLLHESVADQMVALDRQGVTVATISDDVATNRVVVGVISDVARAKEVLGTMFPGRATHLVVEQGPNLVSAGCSSRTVCPTGPTTLTGTTTSIGASGPVDEYLRGGVHIDNYTSALFGLTSSGGRCTSGFAARRNSDRAIVVLTAGHCFEEGTTIKHNGQKVGTVTLARLGGASGIDAEVIKLENTKDFRWAANNWIYAGDPGAPDLATKHEIRSVYSRSAFMGHIVGEPMAKEGTTTEQTVGLVSRTNLTARCTDCRGSTDENPVTMTNMTEATFCAEKGDSGGPVYWGATGHGILSLVDLDPSTGKCKASPRTYFNILSSIETELGVRVIEGPFS